MLPIYLSDRPDTLEVSDLNFDDEPPASYVAAWRERNSLKKRAQRIANSAESTRRDFAKRVDRCCRAELNLERTIPVGKLYPTGRTVGC